MNMSENAKEWNQLKQWLLNLSDTEYSFDMGDGFSGGYVLRVRAPNYPDYASLSLKHPHYQQMIENLLARLQGKDDIYPMPEPEKLKQGLKQPDTKFDFDISATNAQEIILDVNHHAYGGRCQKFMKDFFAQKFSTTITGALYQHQFKKNRRGFAAMVEFADFASTLEIFNQGTDYSIADKDCGIFFTHIINRLACYKNRLTDEELTQGFQQHMRNSYNAHLIPKSAIESGLIRLSQDTEKVLLTCLQKKIKIGNELFDSPSYPVTNSSLNVYGIMKQFSFDTTYQVERFFDEIKPYLRENLNQFNLQNLDISFYSQNKTQAMITAISANAQQPDMRLIQYCLRDFLGVNESLKDSQMDMVKYFIQHPDYLRKLILKCRLEHDLPEKNDADNIALENKKDYKI
jgi:hypothetical protein